MGGSIRQIEVISATALTTSGGATPSVTSGTQDIGGHDFGFSIGLYLINDGLSKDLDVTYDVGYMIPLKDSSIQWDDTANAITGLTTVNVPAGGKYSSQSLTALQYIRFVVTNADASRTADSIRLIMFIQV